MNKEYFKNKFIEKAKEIHKNENLDYSEVIYINNRTPVKIISHDLRPDGTEYGVFYQTPSNHLKGQTHPDKKGDRISKNKILSQEEIIKRFKQIHKNENLDYSEVIYTGMHNKVKIISHDLRPDGTEYGVFYQTPAAHLKGSTHPEIGKLKQIKSQSLTTEELIEKCLKIHNNKKYTYEKTVYNGYRNKILVNCHISNKQNIEHGYFEITPDNFLQGKGCPKCGNHLSNAEDEIIQYIQKYTTTPIIKQEHTILNGKELDIYLPEYKIAFEYNGLRWHSEQFKTDKNYHLNKKLECEKQGITLFHIFEDEFLFHREIIFSKIRNILKLNKNLHKINARNCTVQVIDKSQAEDFLKSNHIQGYTFATIHIGAFYNEKLISVISFLKENKNNWNLVRAASDIKLICRGTLSKIFRYFTKHYNFETIKTFLDRRWERKGENLYDKLGFIKNKILHPDYRYTYGHGERFHKFGFRKQVLIKKYPDKGLTMDMTEKEMCDKLGFYRIWDCGLIKYVYKNQKKV